MTFREPFNRQAELKRHDRPLDEQGRGRRGTVHEAEPPLSVRRAGLAALWRAGPADEGVIEPAARQSSVSR